MLGSTGAPAAPPVAPVGTSHDYAPRHWVIYRLNVWSVGRSTSEKGRLLCFCEAALLEARVYPAVTSVPVAGWSVVLAAL